MSDPLVLRWPMPGRITADGQTVACPVCGWADRLVAAMDLEDRSEQPTYLTCPLGHCWAQQSLPRRLLAELLDEVLRLEPSLLGRLEELWELQARGT